RSNLVGCSTGISAGFATRRILSTKSAARRNRSGKFWAIGHGEHGSTRCQMQKSTASKFHSSPKVPLITTDYRRVTTNSRGLPKRGWFWALLVLNPSGHSEAFTRLAYRPCIERLFDLGRQIICIDVLPLQFFPCHCLAPNLVCHDKPKTSPSQQTGRLLLWCDLGVSPCGPPGRGCVVPSRRSFLAILVIQRYFLVVVPFLNRSLADPSGNQW